MLLGDFHIHTTWSDGRHSLPEVVDLFGRSGHDVIAITDHVVNSDTLLGKAAHRMRLSLTKEKWDLYRAEIDREARRAWDTYRMLVLPGVELTRNGFTGGRSAHALALGVEDFISADGRVEDVLTRARDAGAITVACHPNEQSEWFANTFYLWNRKDDVKGLVHLWELACRWDLFPQVGKAGFAFLGNSDFHRAPHLWAWKTLLDCEKRPEAVLSALRKGKGLGLMRLYEPAHAPAPSLEPEPCEGLPAFARASA